MSGFGQFLRARARKMLDIAPGISTPLIFSDRQREHMATRTAAGLFDFSFMCCVDVAGPQALEFLHALQTRSLFGLSAGRIAYTLILRDDGSVLNDATVWRLDDATWRVFVGRRSDFAHLEETAEKYDVQLRDDSQAHAVIALQGPASRSIIERCFGKNVAALPYYAFAQSPCDAGRCAIARIGYSGEFGFEIVADDASAALLWQRLLAAGIDDRIVECGFEATDSLRIEAGHILFMRELAGPVQPRELGLGRLVDLYAHEFRGACALRARPALTRRLCGLLPATDCKPADRLPQCIRDGAAVMTSVTYSPVLERPVGIGFVNPEDAYPGTRVQLDGGGIARVARLPLYDPAKILSRGPRRGIN